jgi:hypothetical protein
MLTSDDFLKTIYHSRDVRNTTSTHRNQKSYLCRRADTNFQQTYLLTFGCQLKNLRWIFPETYGHGRISYLLSYYQQ